MELILEDSPRDYIYLSYNDGTRAYKYPPYNRKSRELPKDSQKYFWYGTTLSETSETFYDSTTWTTESITSVESSVETERFTDSSTTYYATDETTGVTSRPIASEKVTMEGSGGPEVTTRDLHTTEDLVGDLVTSDSTTIEAETEAVTFPYRTTEWDYLTSDGQHSWDSLSKISLQFIVEVTSPAPSCTFGDYRPKFVSPTPRHGEKLLTNVGSVFQLHLSAQATYETISDFKVSGPPGIAKSLPRSRSTTRSTVAEWRPSESNVGEHVPFCFVAETSNGYQSEMRCIIVVVGPKSLDNIDLICHENTMTLIAAKSADHELYENQFRLNDPKCLVSSNSTHLIASVAYNTCGTEIEETEDEIVFKNQASSFHNESSVITRKHGVSIPFNCSFPKKSRVSASFRAHKSDYVFTEAGFGNFTYTFQFYTDDRFVEVETQYPLQVELRELIYMEIQVSSSIPNVQLFVESCKATPHDNPDDPIFYDIKRNGCIIDETFVEYSSTRTRYRFAMEAFAFIGDYSEVYMSCTVILCKSGDPSTRCNQGCLPKSMADPKRRRRSLTSESQQHFISQGPLRMKRQSPSDTGDVESPSLNVNTLVMSLSGVAIVVLLGLSVHLYTKRRRLSGYQRLQTQEL
ncbi:ZP domain-containing protein-like [Engystomops pustulosus]|uniref:ZP domain-containing protein-like n=1 Tax=Engystomops pustulosus TaxID=76066 RepID=UPI003AFAD9B8